MAIRGSCLCGGVRFTVEQATGPFEICHCTRCRKVTGAAALPGVVVRADALRFVAGHELVRVFEAPLRDAPPAYRTSFCGRCGSPVPEPEPEGELLEIAAGVLDDPIGMAPDRHIYVEHVPSWDVITDGRPALDAAGVRALRLRDPS